MRTNLIRSITAVAVLGMLGPAVAAGQVTDARWRAWIGCWTPQGNSGLAMSAGAVCVVPAEGPSSVDVISVSGTRVIDRTRIQADGQEHPVTRDGCTGTASARWASSGTRVYVTESIACPGAEPRRTSGLMSFDQRFRWLDVRGVRAGGSQGVAVARYAPLTDSAGLPVEVMPAMRQRTVAANDAILAASAPLTLRDIADVATRADSGVATTWLVERTRDVKLELDGRQLTALADEGVPASVIDVLVALSHPESFSLSANAVEPVERPREAARRSSAYDQGYCCAGRYGPYGGYFPYSYYDPYFMNSWAYYGAYGPYYGYSGFYGYGYPGFGIGYASPIYGYYPGAQPIVVVNGPAGSGTTVDTHGRVVKGRGYTSGSSSGSSGASSSSTRSGSGSSTGSAGGSSSGSGASTSSSPSSGSSSSTAPRTAVKKPPQ